VNVTVKLLCGYLKFLSFVVDIKAAVIVSRHRVLAWPYSGVRLRSAQPKRNGCLKVRRWIVSAAHPIGRRRSSARRAATVLPSPPPRDVVTTTLERLARPRGREAGLDPAPACLQHGISPVPARYKPAPSLTTARPYLSSSFVPAWP